MTSEFTQTQTITPHDSTNIPAVGARTFCDAVYVGSIAGGATVTIVKPDDSTQAFTVVAGTIIPVNAKRVNATGTLASALVALYRI